MEKASEKRSRSRRFRRTTDSNHSNPIAPNILARDFKPAAPNQAWAGDMTYIATGEGWSYLAVLLDLFSRRVVGWAMSTTNDTALALTALHSAVRTVRFGSPMRTTSTTFPSRPSTIPIAARCLLGLVGHRFTAMTRYLSRIAVAGARIGAGEKL